MNNKKISHHGQRGQRSGGRPMSNCYEDLLFSPHRKEDTGRLVVICQVCSQTLTNTALQRLKGHRIMCKVQNTSNSQVPETITIDDEDMDFTEPSEELISNSEVDAQDEEEINIDEILAELQQSKSSSNVFNTRTDSILTGEEGSSSSLPDMLCLPSTSAGISNAMPMSAPAPVSAPTSAPAPLRLKQAESRPKPSAIKRPMMPCSPKMRKMDRFVDTIGDGEGEKVTTALAKFFFGCNIPFNVVESKLFKSFITSIRPSYVRYIPSRKTLASKWLDELYDEYKKKAMECVTKDSVLLIDGWKNTASNTKTVVCILHDTATKSKVFINAWNLNGVSETGDKLAEIVCEAIDEAKNTYNIDVYAVVSDNASNMVRMGKNLKHVVWHSTCNSHTANLLAKDVLNKKLTEQVSMVLKQFKQPNMEQSLIAKGGTRIKLPCETRWCSNRDAYACLLKNVRPMKLVAAQTNKLKQSAVTLLFDENFLDSVKANLAKLDPISTLINKCQDPNASLADAVKFWLEMELPEGLEDYYKSRLETAHSTYVVTAYYLHPFYDKAKLSKSKLEVVFNFLLKTLSNEGLNEWDLFKNKDGIFRTLYEKNIDDAILFWKTAEFYAPNISKIALKLLKIPASSAEIERTFSKWSLIHTPLRNRLSFDRSKKLMDLYVNLRMEHADFVIEEEEEDD